MQNRKGRIPVSTRENVLKALEENKGIMVSGEELASRFSISRTAVWKAIQELRKEGYRIEAVTNKGYSLARNSDVLSREGILPHIVRPIPEGRIHVFKSLESTNLTAKKMALEGADAGTVVISEEQTKGRGRMGRSFFSPPAGGIYISFVLRPQLDAAKSVLVTTAASVAVCKAIEAVTGLDCQIKWVNDVYLRGKKICGILTEAVTDFESGQIEHIVLGIGINFSTVFPEELSGIAGSLYEETAAAEEESPVPRNRLIGEVINQVLEVTENLESRDFIPEYRRRSFVLGKEILIIPTSLQGRERNLSEGIRATAVDIDKDGGLKVQYPDGAMATLNSGEISIRVTRN